MSEEDLQNMLRRKNVAAWRIGLARWVEGARLQQVIIAVILINAVILGLDATPLKDSGAAPFIKAADKICLGLFMVELVLKALAYRFAMLRNGWNVFDVVVVAIALVPAAGPASVLRGLRVLRLLRLLTVVPSLRKVVAAFIHAIPGLASVIGLMTLFMYVMAVMATGFFGEAYPAWFGHLGKSLYSLFQIMTLESWSMGIVRPVMETHPWAWMFFVPFIMLGTFTILNLFIGIIVSTMQEISEDQPQLPAPADAEQLLSRIQADLALLQQRLNANEKGDPQKAPPKKKSESDGC